jgi:hypothetical protein
MRHIYVTEPKRRLHEVVVGVNRLGVKPYAIRLESI